MPDKKNNSWGEGELRELLCLMMIGCCVWIVGTHLGLFTLLIDATRTHELQDLLMLTLCMSLGLVAAAIRKSFKLRRAMQDRDGAEAQAESVARHDAMTGLANRRLFRESLAARIRTTTGVPLVAVMLIDLDRFKPVNDVHGHAAGDAVLCVIADRLRALAPTGSLVARLGGDEFAVLLDHGGDPENLARLAQATIASVSQPIAWTQSRLKIGATIGIATASEESRTAEALLHAADVAMYQGKRDGRGTFRFFHLDMGHALKARATLEGELRVGIDRGEIEPFYQPVVALPGRELIGFEVLARWNHPRLGMLSPAEFITLAEETGLIGDLTWSLMRQACRDARAWPSHLQLAINISPLQLRDPHLPKQILGILNEAGFAPGRLEIEITETALVNDLEAARTALQALQTFGVRIALDDFGTGYSSLYHLRELQFDKLKIDRSYVESMRLSSERAKLVDAIIALGSSLGLLTTAEGIESGTSVDWLAGQGCTYGQGYLFGKPMDKATTDGLLRLWSDDSGRIVIAPSQAEASELATCDLPGLARPTVGRRAAA
ncbi:diguanylate cyclase [Methylobacterium sp. Leaf104]|uniref:putative bifunctional diguanylate cyclase/phosphodiesterase n=1 Tax=Methylobacterium TaxID=407 RepID=UPI0006FA687A|nr:MULTISPECIES: EAL domain-containing protein [Methylobacterium]KQP31819.1 diguanylate cyclase [Methylobacterium sp. Leaf104]MCI9880746.1 EAL domain-containing protein [Methylobacterium goesingense]